MLWPGILLDKSPRDRDEDSLLRGDHARAIDLYQMSVLMRMVIERAIANEDITIQKLIESLLSTIEPTLSSALGFEASDIWSIEIFEFRTISKRDRGELRRVAQVASEIIANEDSRVWPSGTGIVGTAFSLQREVLVSDSSLVSPGHVPFNVTGDSADNLYRSVAAVPVGLGGATNPWGVVVASTDRVGHFDHQSASGVKTSEPVRALAGMLGLAVAVLDRKTKHIGEYLPLAASADSGLDFGLRTPLQSLEETSSLESEIDGITENLVAMFLAGVATPGDLDQFERLIRVRRRRMSPQKST